MSKQVLIKKMVRQAFKIAGDLVKTVQLVQSHPSGYNFASAAVSATPVTQVSIQAIVQVKDRHRGSKEPMGMVHATLLIASEDLHDPSVFDRVVIDGIQWSISEVPKDDGFLLTLSVSRRS